MSVTICVMDIQFNVDESGFPHVKVKSDYKLLELYLENDVQYSKYIAEKVLDKIHNIVTGKQTYEKIIGNAFRLILEKDTVRIESLFDEPPLELSLRLKEFEEIIIKWKSLILTCS